MFIKKGILFLLSSVLFVSNIYAMESDNIENFDSIPEICITTSLKRKDNLLVESASSTILNMEKIEKNKIISLSDFSSYVPNLYIPHYGSKITSSIYVRGLGSRMENSVVEVYVDDIPCLNKNAFDIDLWDIVRMENLRGPQGTLYGRNTICGIINVYTLSPEYYSGTKLGLSFGSQGSRDIKFAKYMKLNDKNFLSLGLNYYHTDGFFDNAYTGKNCDNQDSYQFRAKYIYKPGRKLKVVNTVNADYVDMGGYAYFLSGSPDVSYNDRSGYKRMFVNYGLNISYIGKYKYSNVFTVQNLNDKMNLDQDFTPASIFRMEQKQNEFNVFEDFNLKNKDEDSKYKFICGVSATGKYTNTDAPVVFLDEGIQTLILDNANAGFGNPDVYLDINEDNFIMNSRFDVPVYELAVYHQSEYDFGNFEVEAGIRFDYEYSTLHYKNDGGFHYDWHLPGRTLSNIPFETKLDNNASRYSFSVLPKLSLKYNVASIGNVYATVSEGFRSGGFNLQMFSDILKIQMMNGLLENLGFAVSGNGYASYDIDDIITYDPETSWNYEAGYHFNFLGNKLHSDLALFYITCRDQQITVFPEGAETTGRMMSNAGESRSYGTEISLRYEPVYCLNFLASYGYTNAKFKKYNDYQNDYSGKYIPYSPQNTFSFAGSYVLNNLGKKLDRISFNVSYNGAGDIYWDNANKYKQDYYSVFNGSVVLSRKKAELIFNIKNIFNSDYNTFYFESLGKQYYSRGDRRSFSVGLNINL